MILFYTGAIILLDTATGFGSQLIQLAALVGFLLPLAISVIQQTHWSDKARSIVAAVIIVIATTITAWANGDLDWDNWAAALITIYTLSQVAYYTFWKKTGIAQKIEKATSVDDEPDGY